MRWNRSRLLSLLNLNGEIDMGRVIWEKYNISSVLDKEGGRSRDVMDLLNIGDNFIEKIRRIRALNARPEKLGINPYGGRLARRNRIGRILGR